MYYEGKWQQPDKEDPSWKDERINDEILETDSSKYELDYDLLLRKFNEERRLKTAFIIQLAIDAEELNRFLVLEKKIDPVDLEKERLFSYFDINYKESLGYIYHINLKERFEGRWRYERHLIHISNLTGLASSYFHELADILETVNVIYYDITLVELLYSMKVYMNWKEKEFYLELIDIQLEPSLKIFLNYDQYSAKFDLKVDTSMELNASLTHWFTKHRLSWRKVIKSPRAIDEVDMFDKFAVVKNFWHQNPAFEFHEYDANRQKEITAIIKIFSEWKIREELVLNADFIKIWARVVSERCFEDMEEESNIYEINFLKSKWSRSSDWYYTTTKNEQLENPIIFVNVLKLDSEQFLNLNITEKEQLCLYKKNTILFNERYNIWYLRLIPMRVQLPIQLKIPVDTMRIFIKKKYPSMKGFLIIYPW
jgi:hypothetical protein